MQRGARPQAPRPNPPWPHLHSRVALLLSGVKATLKATKPEILEERGDTLGARLRRRRRELGLNLAETSKRLGIVPKTLTWWEHDERLPFVHAYPAVIRFLGLEPWEPPNSLADALLAERRRRGLGVKQAAPMIGVDEGTWLRWERREWKPTGGTLPKINRFLGCDARESYPSDVR
jgi:transcriptional regulator with XRE-family HTH domain